MVVRKDGVHQLDALVPNSEAIYTYLFHIEFEGFQSLKPPQNNTIHLLQRNRPSVSFRLKPLKLRAFFPDLVNLQNGNHSSQIHHLLSLSLNPYVKIEIRMGMSKVSMASILQYLLGLPRNNLNRNFIKDWLNQVLRYSISSVSNDKSVLKEGDMLKMTSVVPKIRNGSDSKFRPAAYDAINGKQQTIDTIRRSRSDPRTIRGRPRNNFRLNLRKFPNLRGFSSYPEGIFPSPNKSFKNPTEKPKFK
ncbi:hypothetical protein L1887_37572 [Cichorium endivia]|nr:hypothetical protein L1887_37572 [Cichorium endivia]